MDADDDVLQVCQMRPPKVTKATLGGIIQLTATRLRKRRIATYAPVARAYAHTILVSPVPSSCAHVKGAPAFPMLAHHVIGSGSGHAGCGKITLQAELSSARLLKVSLYRRVSIEDCRNCGQN